jgi:3-deoxy-D-arabino-heptulosonate 7-phosphate (DAHP) synthase
VSLTDACISMAQTVLVPVLELLAQAVRARRQTMHPE